MCKTAWHVEEFKPGVALPSIYSTGTNLTVQATLDSVVTAAAAAGVSLTFSGVTAPTDYNAAGANPARIRYKL